MLLKTTTSISKEPILTFIAKIFIPFKNYYKCDVNNINMSNKREIILINHKITRIRYTILEFKINTTKQKKG